ncbi:MAG TPA: hypothetical protein IAA01_09540 [Candidatus Fournierella excrementavium]|nr:hypothetical protein [Candidatus Fournierella excrementavium]
MASDISPEKLEEYKAYVREHPPHSKWDEEAECFDADLPFEESQARLARSLLQCLDEWDHENDCPKP